jgi:[acyl-carrier-protein] S-malonyltransferase
MSTAFLFPGQGAQTVGMGRDLAASLPAAKALFEYASAILGYDLLDVCTNGPAEKLNATNVSQPAIFVASMAALEQLKATDPAALDGVAHTAGLSLGEYTALCYAGAISFADAVGVVKARGEAMQAAAEATPSGMVAVLAIEVPQVQELVDEAKGAGVLEIANFLCPGNTVISGSAAAIEKACEIAAAKNYKVAKLAVAGAFHTNLMKPADERLAEALANATFHTPRIPVWSNVDAKPHTDPAEIKALLVKQVLSPVLWEATLRGLLESGTTKFYEIGPGRVLAGLLKRVLRKAEIVNIGA